MNSTARTVHGRIRWENHCAGLAVNGMYSPSGLLGRFWASPRSDATENRERQLTLDFMVAATGGPAFYTGRAMKMAHDGMGITTADYAAFMACLNATLDAFGVPETERNEVNTLIVGLEAEVVADDSA